MIHSTTSLTLRAATTPLRAVATLFSLARLLSRNWSHFSQSCCHTLLNRSLALGSGVTSLRATATLCSLTRSLARSLAFSELDSLLSELLPHSTPLALSLSELEFFLSELLPFSIRAPSATRLLGSSSLSSQVLRSEVLPLYLHCTHASSTTRLLRLSSLSSQVVLDSLRPITSTAGELPSYLSARVVVFSSFVTLVRKGSAAFITLHQLLSA